MSGKGKSLQDQTNRQGQPGQGRWVAGQSGNPAGRPTGSRQRIAERLLIDIHDVWEACGRDILFRLARDEPGKLASIAYGLLPRDVFVSVQAQPAAIDPEQWELLVGIARTMKEVAPDASLPEIEDALRSAFAKPVLDASSEVGTPRPMGGQGPMGGAVGARGAGDI